MDFNFKNFVLFNVNTNASPFAAGTVAEQVMVLENIGTSVLVSENQVTCETYPK